MGRAWIAETNPRWDAGKQRIVGGAPAGAFHLGDLSPDAPAPGEWFRVEEDGQTVGYGWMDVVWGDGEVLLAVDPAAQRRGLGAFILDHLEQEAAARGLNRIYNTVRPSHPDRAAVSAWLRGRGFSAPEGDEALVREVRRH